jgi:hypothetical protein
MKTVANRIDLGITRVAGYNLYDEASLEFQETTPKEVKNLIKNNMVNGLKLENGEIILDTEGFNINNLMIKSSVGKFRTLHNTNSIVKCMYAVVRVIETDNEKFYEIISNKCARFKFKIEQLKGLIEIGGYVAGVRIINNEIEVCKGVTIEDRRSKAEHTYNQCNTEGEEDKASIDVGIQEQQGLSVLKADAKPDKAVSIDETESTEKVDIFDTLEVEKLTSECVIKADDKNLKISNTPKGNGAKPQEGHIDKKEMVTNRKTKRK